MSRLETVRRVAALRTGAARAAVGAAGVRRELAEQEYRELVDGLARTCLAGGVAPEVGGALAGLQRRADAVRAAAEQVGEREGERQAALAVWSAAACRTGLLDEVCGRHRLERAHTVELRVQSLLDDLAARRSGRWA